MPTLLETMALGVDARCEAKLAEARREGDALIAAARLRADGLYAKGLDAVRAEIKRAADQDLRLAHAEAEKLVLAAQHSVADEALAQVNGRLAAVASSEGFGATIEVLLAQAVNAARGEFEVLAPAAHVDRCRAWLSGNGHGGVPVHAANEFSDGVAVQDRKRTYRITNTLSSRYAKLEPQARKILMAKLFGHGGAA